MKSLEGIKTHILCPVTFLWKSRRLWDNVEEYGAVRKAAGNMASARGMLDETTRV
jgi:hypothetical protein